MCQNTITATVVSAVEERYVSSIVVQLKIKESLIETLIETRIEKISIRGRPKSPHSGTMGDHTTAFVVHTEGIAIALTNPPQTLDQAKEKVAGWVTALCGLPGYTIAPTNDDSVFCTHKKMIDDLGSQYAKEKTTDRKIHLLQQMIAAYLTMREHLPYSTIKVNAVSQGKSGKGHGETSAIKILSAYETDAKDLKNKISESDIELAIYSLFDNQAAAVCRNHTDRHQILAPCNQEQLQKNGDSILNTIWTQHIKSIEMMFPESYKVVSARNTITTIDPTIIEKAKLENLRILAMDADTFANKFVNSGFDILSVNLFKYVVKGKVMNASAIDKLEPFYIAENKAINAYIRFQNAAKGCVKYSGKVIEIWKTINNVFGHMNYSMGKSTNEPIFVTKHYDAPSKIIGHLTYDDNHKQTVLDFIRARTYEWMWLELPVHPGTNDEKIDSTDKNDSSTDKMVVEDAKNDPQNGEYGTSTSEKIDSTDKNDSSTDEMVVEGAKNDPQNGEYGTSTSGYSTKSSAMENCTVAIMIDTNGIIQDVAFGGRPESPFSGTMGAHTTAWIVILDWIRSNLIGSKIDVAHENVINKVIKELTNYDKPEKTKPVGYCKDGERCKYKKELAGVAKDKKNVRLDELQKLVGDTLSYYNLIPGVTIKKTDTSGHGEAAARADIIKVDWDEGEKIIKWDKLKGPAGRLFDSGNSGAAKEFHNFVILATYGTENTFLVNAKAKANSLIAQQGNDGEAKQVEVDDEKFGDPLMPPQSLREAAFKLAKWRGLNPQDNMKNKKSEEVKCEMDEWIKSRLNQAVQELRGDKLIKPTDKVYLFFNNEHFNVFNFVEGPVIGGEVYFVHDEAIGWQEVGWRDYLVESDKKRVDREDEIEDETGNEMEGETEGKKPPHKRRAK